MASKDFTITKSGRRSFRVDFRSLVDPTGGSVDFGLSAARNAEPSTWVAGSWIGYEDLIDRAQADTPTMGDASAGIDVTGDDLGRYVLWYKVTVGSEVDIAPWTDGTISIIT